MIHRFPVFLDLSARNRRSGDSWSICQTNVFLAVFLAYLQDLTGGGQRPSVWMSNLFWAACYIYNIGRNFFNVFPCKWDGEGLIVHDGVVVGRLLDDFVGEHLVTYILHAVFPVYLQDLTSGGQRPPA